jgi:hypothetical protein
MPTIREILRLPFNTSIQISLSISGVVFSSTAFLYTSSYATIAVALSTLASVSEDII